MDDQCILQELTVPRTAHGLRVLMDAIARHQPDPAQVLVAAERPDGPFLGGLLDAGYTVYAINPKAVERYRDRFALGGTKSDLVDARCLASILRTDRDAHRALRPDSPLTRELRMLTRDLAELEKTQTMLVLQLRAALFASFPAAVHFFPDLSAPSALGFLQRFPTLDAVRAASSQEMEETLKAHGHTHAARRVRRIREILAEEQFAVDAAVVRAKSRLIVALAGTLLALHRQIHDYDRQLRECFQRHPDREIFLSLPGAGPRLAARLAAEFGDDRQRFPDARAVAAFAGAAPVTRQSGKSLVVPFRRSCCKPFRETLHQFTFCSLRWNAWAWNYYKLKRKAGKRHAESLRCLACVWLRIIHAMWRHRAHYHPVLFPPACCQDQPASVEAPVA
jgi:transposase